MMMYWEEELWFHAFVSLALDEGERSDSPLAALAPGKEPWHSLDRRLGGHPRNSMDALAKIKEVSSLSLPEIDPRPSSP